MEPLNELPEERNDSLTRPLKRYLLIESARTSIHHAFYRSYTQSSSERTVNKRSLCSPRYRKGQNEFHSHQIKRIEERSSIWHLVQSTIREI